MNIKQTVAEQTVTKLWNNTQLDYLEKEVLRRHYGMDKGKGKRPQELEEISEYINIDVEIIELAHKSAIKKLRETAKLLKISWNGVGIK